MSVTDINFRPGQEISGRWDGHRYTVIRELGSGGTARVLLVKNTEHKYLAMKVSRDLPGITREHRTLLFLNSNRDIKHLGIIPGVYELDDYWDNGHTYHYIIMDYCPGRVLQDLKGGLSPGEISNVGLMLAIFLHYLHQAGFVYGDLKPGNILYDRATKKLSIVDFGSVCPKGRSLQQYTPLYDRSSWQAGSRSGDEKYDLFALSMLLLSLQSGTGDYMKKRSINLLLKKLKPLEHKNDLLPVIVKGLRQEYEVSCKMAFDLWRCRGRQTIFGHPSNSGAAAIRWGINLAGAVSAFFFIVSLLYYYQ